MLLRRRYYLITTKIGPNVVKRLFFLRDRFVFKYFHFALKNNFLLAPNVQNRPIYWDGHFPNHASPKQIYRLGNGGNNLDATACIEIGRPEFGIGRFFY